MVIFLPQILILFFFLGMLEDSGYMARAAFIMDRLMARVGLHGKSFIPLLSSFACAIPGIMATRTIENRKDRLVTILVAPLMSCSARLPVYSLDDRRPHAGRQPDGRKSGIMLACISSALCAAFGMAWLFKKTLLRGETPMLLLELPPYRLPSLRIDLCYRCGSARSSSCAAPARSFSRSPSCSGRCSTYPEAAESGRHAGGSDRSIASADRWGTRSSR